MTKRIRLFTAITALALTGMLTLQGYFLYVTYQDELAQYRQDANTALELIMPDVEEERVDRILELHRRDILDSTLISLSLEDSEEGGSIIVLSDPKTGYRHLSYGYTKEEKDGATKKEIFDRLVDRLMNTKTIYFSLTEEVDRRRDLYQDTVSIDIDFMRTKLNERFVKQGLSLDYEFDFLEEEEAALVKSDSLLSDYVEVEIGDRVAVVFNQPVLNILRRIYLIVIASALVVILIAVSFFALIRTINRQRQLSSLKDDFIDGMTHELLTPIATLKIALESLQNPIVKNDPEKTDKYLHVSRMELMRVSDIVHNVLYSSLHEQEQAQLKMEKVDLNELMSQLADYHQTRNSQPIDISFQPLKDPWLVTDKQHLTNVLHNLIDNAIKYAGEEKAKVSIVLTRTANELSIMVNDNGSGIPEGEQSKIFDKFYRAVEARAAHIKGLGVGLYYVKTILSRLNGNIELLQSSPNGSSFRVSLNLDHSS